MNTSLNDPIVLQKLRQKQSGTRRPKDWHPVLDRIMDTLGISLVWTPVKSVGANKGTSGVAMFYQDRTIFISPNAPKHYLPEWHEICHAIAGRELLDEPNYGNERLSEEETNSYEFKTQSVQMYLLNRYLEDKKKVQRAAQAFGVEWEPALVEGREIIAQQLPELPELLD